MDIYLKHTKYIRMCNFIESQLDPPSVRLSQKTQNNVEDRTQNSEFQKKLQNETAFK